MILRWVVASVEHASKTFRKLRGHAGMPTLVGHLRKLDDSSSTAASEAA
jgi:hypothetical protein